MLLTLALHASVVFAEQFSASVSTGYEKVTSPLVRIDTDSPLIFVEGRTKLAGHYNQVSINGVKDWQLGNAVSMDISANAYVKEATSAKDLNFSQVSLDTSWRKNLGRFNIGFGPSVQRIWVASQSFRDSASLQTDFTLVESNGSFTNLYMALSKSRYVDDFDFLDSKTITASLTHHINNIGFGFSAFDLQLNANREKNTRHFDDLSSDAYYARVSIDREMLGLTWSLGASLTKSYFDAPFFEGFDKRRDAYVSYEFGVERQVSDKWTFNVDLNQGENKSNLALFESKYKSANLSLSYRY
jgi:hypothetical protein